MKHFQILGAALTTPSCSLKFCNILYFPLTKTVIRSTILAFIDAKNESNWAFQMGKLINCGKTTR